MHQQQISDFLNLPITRLRITPNRYHLFHNGCVCSYSKDELITMMLKKLKDK